MINFPLYDLQIDEIVKRALQEDINYQDFTANSIFSTNEQAQVDLLSKDHGVLSGLKVFLRCFELLDPNVTYEIHLQDGDNLSPDDLILTLKGQARALLSAERVALNILQRMSGIASYTKRMAEALDDPRIKLVDTRKTNPGLRILDKYSVLVGGGFNHRYNLSDSILLKDNHISYTGSVAKAIKNARSYAPFNKIVEVECESLKMVRDAVEAGADIIMLDNMDIYTTLEAIKIIDGRAQVEASGNITVENISRYRGVKIDAISSGALTHSAGIIDLSMKNMKVVE